MICWTVENGRHVTGTNWRIPQGSTTSHVEVNHQVTKRFLSSLNFWSVEINWVAKPSNGRCDVDQQLLVPRNLCFVQLRRTNHPTPTKFYSALQLFEKSSILRLEWIQYQHVWTDSPSIWCRNIADNVYKSRWFCRSWVKIFFLDWQSYAQWVWFFSILQGPQQKWNSEVECFLCA